MIYYLMLLHNKALVLNGAQSRTAQLIDASYDVPLQLHKFITDRLAGGQRALKAYNPFNGRKHHRPAEICRGGYGVDLLLVKEGSARLGGSHLPHQD